jgi:hypothetical protein
MIPQRRLRHDFTGSELRARVTACRKRLRSSRFTQKPAVGCDFDQDSRSQKATFLDDESAMRESLANSDLSSAALDTGNDTPEVLLTMRPQEVGIT